LTLKLGRRAQAVQQALAEHGLELSVIELTESCRTALQAAEAVNCELGQIVKSLVFRISKTQSPVLVTASGSNRVSEKKIRQQLGESISRANADFVREHTGYAIGGVAPLGHPQPIQTFIDEDLFQYDKIWAAAGTPNALFSMRPGDLKIITGGIVADVRE
jgi:prolyl-tRNA editing enzyme YbaK/EbsC (Cys-tRNA(Pro) deacylase)